MLSRHIHSFKFLFASFILGGALCSSLVAKANMINQQDLVAGQCFSDPDSKNYLASLKASQGSGFDKIKKEIGLERVTHLVDTPSATHYFCKVTCRLSSEKVQDIWVDLVDNSERFGDLNGFLCTGVSIEQVQIVGSIFGPQPVIQPFWGFQSQLQEVHDWLKGNDFKIDPLQGLNLFSELKKNLKEIISSYLSTGVPLFTEAAKTLSDISEQNPSTQIDLEKRLSDLESKHWNLPQGLSSSDDLVNMNLKIFGRFLVYLP